MPNRDLTNSFFYVRFREGAKTVTINNVHLDSETYRALSMKAYHENAPMQSLVLEMLKKHLAIGGFLKNDFRVT